MRAYMHTCIHTDVYMYVAIDLAIYLCESSINLSRLAYLAVYLSW